MIGYVTVGTNDLDRAVKFYDELFAVLGAGRFMEEPGAFVAWARALPARAWSSLWACSSTVCGVDASVISRRPCSTSSEWK